MKDRDRVRRVLAMSADERDRFDAAEFMGVRLADMDADELRGLVVWVLRNRHYRD